MVDSRSKKRLLVVTVVLLGLIGFMIYNSTASSVSYFKKIGEVTADDTYIGKSVRVGGMIKEYKQEGHKLTFTIFDKDDKSKELTITYSKPKPQTFGADIEAIVEGKLVSRELLEAESLTTRCPSKYNSKKAGGE